MHIRRMVRWSVLIPKAALTTFCWLYSAISRLFVSMTADAMWVRIPVLGLISVNGQSPFDTPDFFVD